MFYFDISGEDIDEIETQQNGGFWVEFSIYLKFTKILYLDLVC